MVIYCDRNDGIFTPQMSDRINIKSDSIYDKISSINVTPIYPHLEIVNERVNDNAVTSVGVSNKVDNSFRLGGHLHVINVLYQFTNARNFDTFTTVCNLTVAPNTDIITQYNDGQYFILVEKGTTQVKVLGNPQFDLSFYFFYVT